MAAYHFITRWHLQATSEEVYRILEDVDQLPTWWPSVYLDVKTIEKGAPGGVGRVVALFTKGWLPYTLRWSFRVTNACFPNGFALTAFGDFVGRGIWTFTQLTPETCEVVYDWQIEAEKPLLKRLSFLLRPIFSSNHYWAMDQGLTSLKLELLRRRARSLAEQEAVPAPPRPTFWAKQRRARPVEV